VNLDPTSALAAPHGPSPEVAQARAALGTQLAGLAHALARLESLRTSMPAAERGSGWRGAAHSAYGAGVADLGRQLDEATEAVRDARRSTSHALTVLASRA
jgi:uncharacterized protein YukE